MQLTIPHALISPNIEQPRKTFERRELEDLAASIRENGLLQPITVRAVAGVRYEIVAGERRWRAHGILIEQGYAPASEVLCNVVEMDEETRDIAAIIENLQRVDVLPLEEGRAFKRMLDLGMEIETLAKKLGRAVWRIEERVRLMSLDPSIIKLCEGGFDHHVAQEIARLPSHRDQIALTQMWSRGQISGFKALKAAVAAKLEGMSQSDMFGEAEPRASDAEVEAVRGMEAKIERMASLAAAGWKDGDCVVAAKVSRDRARLMAEKIKAMRAALFAMEGELRAAAAQAEIVLEAAE
jgi:ParB family transcriptional regulator, chromosome partitioning protein